MRKESSKTSSLYCHTASQRRQYACENSLAQSYSIANESTCSIAHKKSYKNGFTLIELVIVVAIIGILSMIAVPQFNKVTQNARNSTWEANCQTVLSAIAMFQADHNGAVPKYDDELDDYLNGGFAALNANGGTPDGAKYQFSTDLGTGISLGGSALANPAVYFESVYENYTGNNKTYKYGITSTDSQGKFVYKLR